MPGSRHVETRLVAPLSSVPHIEAEVERWDLNAPTRDLELRDNDDPSYRALKHLVLARIANAFPGFASVLDVGCGTGHLSGAIADAGYSVKAIDPSPVSIRIAVDNHGSADGRRPAGSLDFENTSLQDFAKHRSHSDYDVVVLNMTLHAVQKLPTFFQACAALLSPNGVVVATIPNPDTYLQARTDIDVKTVDLRRDQLFEIPFRIHSHSPHPASVFFYHRPFRTYADAARAAGLYLSDYAVPEQVGIGKARDIALLEFKHWSQ